MIEVRPYQDTILDGTRQCFRQGHRRVLIVSATGSGKTRTAAALIEGAISKGNRVWWMTHRRELVKQSFLVFHDLGLPCAIVQSGVASDQNAPLQVCSIDTLRARHHKLPPPDLMIFDEAHRMGARTWHQLADSYPKAARLGLTGSPIRTDGTGLGHFFDAMVEGPSTSWLIANGWLSPYRIFGPKPPNLEGIHTVAGDYDKKELDERMKATSICGDIVEHYKKFVPGKMAIVFMWSVDASVEIAKRFNEAGVSAAHIDGETDTRVRDQITTEFKAGRIKVLSNFSIVSEGYDCPAVDAGFYARPTQSLVVHLQQLGRVLRPADNKTAMIFDHTGNCMKFGGPEEVHEWTLEDGDALRKKRKKDTTGKFRTCPKCEELHPMSVRVCPCGFVLVQVKEMEVDEDAELHEVDPATLRRERMREQGSANDLAKLTAIGKARGYKHPDNWARIILRARADKQAARDRQRVLVSQPQTELDDRWAF